MGKANHMCSLLIVIKVSEVKTNKKIVKAVDGKSKTARTKIREKVFISSPSDA
jgi:hypothetical protein